VATVVGAGVAAIGSRAEPGAGRWLVSTGLLLLPVLLLADAAWGIGGRLAAVSYPPGYATMREAVATGPPGDVLVLPLSAFRRPAWNGSRTVLDPVGRYQPRDYVSSDVLVVGGISLEGEDPRVADVVRALAQPTAEERSAELAALGIAIVVTDHTAPGEAPEVAGRMLTQPDADLTAVAVEGAVRQRTPPVAWSVALGAAWLAFVTIALLLPPFLGWRRRLLPRP
jgi:hypothetical protein